jgi:flavin-dependent dehydrogenase
MANVCGLFRMIGVEPSLKTHWESYLRGPAGSPLRRLLQSAQFIPESFCAVAGLGFQSEPLGNGKLLLGDAAGMIAPLTGNGMSIAMESASIAAAPLAAWSEGSSSWEDAVAQIGNVCASRFRKRIVWARRLQDALLAEGRRKCCLMLFNWAPWMIRYAYGVTHR